MFSLTKKNKKIKKNKIKAFSLLFFDTLSMLSRYSYTPPNDERNIPFYDLFKFAGSHAAHVT